MVVLYALMLTMREVSVVCICLLYGEVVWRLFSFPYECDLSCFYHYPVNVNIGKGFCLYNLCQDGAIIFFTLLAYNGFGIFLKVWLREVI